MFLHLFIFHQIVRSHHLNLTQNYILQCPDKLKLIFTLFNRIWVICVQQLLQEQGQKEGVSPYECPFNYCFLVKALASSLILILT